MVSGPSEILYEVLGIEGGVIMPSWVEGLIGVISGGSLLAIISVVVEHFRGKRQAKAKDIDDRISFWENAARMNDDRIAKLENKINLYVIRIKTLENHISVLEQMIIRLDPTVELPPRPQLDIM